MNFLTLYTKENCHLCDEMKAVILSLKEEYDFDFTETDITLDKLLFKKYNIKIPVLMIDGKMFAKYTVDKVKLRRKLTV